MIILNQLSFIFLLAYLGSNERLNRNPKVLLSLKIVFFLLLFININIKLKFSFSWLYVNTNYTIKLSLGEDGSIEKRHK